ncbi:MAG: Crp/Fnr family transcriptional regulator [Thiohalomonadales bacterium]
MNPPQDCRDCRVWTKSLFKDLDSQVIENLADKKQIKKLVKKEALFTQGNEITGIYCHMSGMAKVAQKDTKKKIRFSRLVLPGDTSGHRSLFIESSYKGTAYVISDKLMCCFIPKEEILHLLASQASFAKNLVIKIATELKRSENNHISVKEKTARSRFAELMYDLCIEYSEQISEKQFLLKSELSKREIASLLAVANETVIRLMSEMKAENLIAYRDKKILIVDIDKLKVSARL